MGKPRKRTIMKYTELYSEAERRYRELSEIKKEKDSSAAKELPGKIHVAVSDKRVKYYLRTDKLIKQESIFQKQKHQ